MECCCASPFSWQRAPGTSPTWGNSATGDHGETLELFERCSNHPYSGASGSTSCSARQRSPSSISSRSNSKVLIRSTSRCSLGSISFRVGSTVGSARPHKSRPHNSHRPTQRTTKPHRPQPIVVLDSEVSRSCFEAQRRGSALRTEMARPIHSTFCRSSIADCSSASLLRSTKAKPRLRPVSRSRGKEHLLTSPY